MLLPGPESMHATARLQGSPRRGSVDLESARAAAASCRAVEDPIMSSSARDVRKGKELAWRRELVLDGAALVFARKGFHAATMQEIAEETGYSTGNLYNLFENKEALFAALLTRTIAEIDLFLRQTVELGQAPTDKLHRFLEGFFEFCDQRREFFEIFVKVTGGFLWNIKSEIDTRVQGAHEGFLELVEGIIREGVQSGEFRSKVNPHLLAVSTTGVISSVATDWITRAPNKSATSLFVPTRDAIDGMLGSGSRGPSKRNRRAR